MTDTFKAFKISEGSAQMRRYGSTPASWVNPGVTVYVHEASLRGGQPKRDMDGEVYVYQQPDIHTRLTSYVLADRVVDLPAQAPAVELLPADLSAAALAIGVEFGATDTAEKLLKVAKAIAEARA